MKYIVIFPIQALVFFLNCIMHLFIYIFVFIWDLKPRSFKEYLLDVWVSSYRSIQVSNESIPQILKRWFNFEYY